MSKILILVGSGDVKSHSLGLGYAISDGLNERNVETEIINLIEYNLPLYNRSIERSESYDALTKTFLDKSIAAAGFVWVTPIHHNSFSAILKNALDWQHTKFPDKIVGLASNGGNRSPQAVDQLMLVARAQHLLTARVRVCTDASDYDENLQISNPDIQNRVQDFCDEIDYLLKFQNV